MNNNSTVSSVTLRSFRDLTAVALAAIMLLVAPVAGFAQETTGSVRGTVLTPNGDPAAGELVTVTDTRTGSSRSATTNDSGSFNIRGLTIGGPYTIRVDSGTYEDQLVTDVYTNLSAAATFTIALMPSDTAIEEIVVTSRMVETAALAVGPGTAFSLEEIEAMPSIARQIRDVVRIDPRVSIGASAGGNGSGINCMGGSPRSNSFTIDGVRAADGFGLNEGSGNSTRNTFPIPFDTVASASVEFAPLDVQYSQFTGCNVNIVTKSGTNEFHGSAVYLFNDDSLTGHDLKDDRVITEPFEDTNWAAEVGGPIIKDRLFFYVSYEETDEGGIQNDGCIGCGFANEDFVTLAEAEQIRGILSTQYQRDTLDIVRSLPQESTRKFARLDWNINDNHRFEATYTELEESNLEPDDYGRFGGFTFGDNFELEGTEQEATSLRLFSNWTDNFSTEIRYSSLEVQDIQGPQGGGEAQDDNKPRIQILDSSGNFLFTSGPGRFRSANDLKYTTDQIKIAADYVTGDHTITVGFEQETRDIFNLFVDNGTGLITFTEIAGLQSGIATSIAGNGSFTGNISDAAAAFERDINSFYVQDEWQISDALTVIAGLRFDSYDSSDTPIENPVFEQRYGFKNTQAFDGLELLQPRIGLTYDMPYDRWGNTQISAGFGIFGGGDPTVHFANSYQNFGGAIGAGNAASAPCTPADLDVASSGTFTGIPACVTQQQINQATSNAAVVAAVDPNFDLPANHRWSFGISHLTETDSEFFSDWDIQFDYIYTDHKDATTWYDLTLTGDGTILPDGRERFMAVDPLLLGCNATFNGPGLGFSNAGPAGGPCDAGGDDQDILMTNGVEGSTTSVSLQLGKDFDLSDRTSLDLRFGYAYTDAEVGNGINSSTATSSFEEVSVVVPNQVTLAPAMWANKHNFVLRASLQHYFMEGHPTTFGMFLRRRSGRPFSFAYDNNTGRDLFGDSDAEERILPYIPTGVGDPLVDFSGMSQQQVADFFTFLDATGLSKSAGKIAPRNKFNQPWSTDIDIRIQQDVPLPWADHSFKVFLDIENLLNLFQDKHNVQTYIDQGDVEEAVPLLDASLSADGSQYIYTNFNPGNGNSAPFGFNPINDRDVDDSVYRIQLGIRYEF